METISGDERILVIMKAEVGLPYIYQSWYYSLLFFSCSQVDRSLPSVNFHHLVLDTYLKERLKWWGVKYSAFGSQLYFCIPCKRKWNISQNQTYTRFRRLILRNFKFLMTFSLKRIWNLHCLPCDTKQIRRTIWNYYYNLKRNKIFFPQKKKNLILFQSFWYHLLFHFWKCLLSFLSKMKIFSCWAMNYHVCPLPFSPHFSFWLKMSEKFRSLDRLSPVKFVWCN